MSMFPKSDDASNDKFNPTNKNNEELKKCKSSLYSIIESDIIPRLLNYQNTDSMKKTHNTVVAWTELVKLV